MNSILKSDLSGYSYELIVVDNASTDESFPYLKKKYGGQVQFIKNEENLGFGRACNQGARQARGEYILFLNPDTLIPPHTLKKCLGRLRNENDKQIIGLGVKLLDGSGRFLPESKRGLPTIWNSFCKLSGLSTLIPTRFFGGYNLTYLPQDQEAIIPALCGAFMLFERAYFEKIGGFDPDYFMYGEDLDLCTRIKQEGGKIIYFPEANIVHFKGESYRKKNLIYFSNFYSAMSLYAEKHFSRISALFLKVTIFFAAFLSYIIYYSRLHFQKIFHFILLLGLIVGIKSLWARIIFNDSEYYGNAFVWYAITFPSILILALISSGSYKENKSFRNIASGYITGVIVSLAVYALFPENIRFSRSILILFLIGSPLVIYFANLVHNKIWVGKSGNNRPRTLFVGNREAYVQLKEWINYFNKRPMLIGYLSAEDNTSMGSTQDLAVIIELHRPDEIIFDSRGKDFDMIFQAMSKYGERIKFKIAGEKEWGIIGSTNSRKAGELYLIDFNYKINDVNSKFLKRTLDLVVGILIVLTFPFWLFYKKKVLNHIPDILVGRKSWVGYGMHSDRVSDLPPIKNGVIPLDLYNANDQDSFDVNITYAKNYSIFVDLELMAKYFFQR